MKFNQIFEITGKGSLPLIKAKTEKADKIATFVLDTMKDVHPHRDTEGKLTHPEAKAALDDAERTGVNSEHARALTVKAKKPGDSYTNAWLKRIRDRKIGLKKKEN